MATIVSGSPDTRTNGRPSARASGRIDAASPVAEADEAQEDPSFLGTFFQQLWSPTVAAPDPRAVPCEGDKIVCKKHPPMPEQYLAEGSSKVTINGQPAVRSGDRSTCEAKVSEEVSPNVRIGGPPVVVREIHSGKPGWMRLATMLSPGRAIKSVVTAGLRASLRSVFSSVGRNLGKSAPCLVINAGMNLGMDYASARLAQAGAAVMNPVHAALGSKFLMGDEDLDIELPASLPLRVQRVYNSRDARRGTLFGVGWSVEYEVEIVRESRPASAGGPQHVYIDEQGRKVELGDVQAMDAFHDAALGMIVRRAQEGPIVIETLDGTYRIFEQDPHNAARLRLALLGDRNSNVLRLSYDAAGRIDRIREEDGPGTLALHYDHTHSRRATRIDYLHDGEPVRTVAAYAYSPEGQLTEVRNASDQVTRRFGYDPGHRLTMHETPTGQQCHYDWQYFPVPGAAPASPDHWRVTRYHSNVGDEVHISYDLEARTTRTRDSLGRTTVRHWDDTAHITAYLDEVGIETRFEWSERGQLLACIDAAGGRWSFSYDDWGNCIEERDPLGHTHVRDYIGARTLPRHDIDPEGHSWHYRYDPHGNLLEQLDPGGQRTRFSYDAQGRLIQSEDPLGNITILHRDARGLLTEHIDPSGQRTRFTWDAMGHLASVTDALGETTRYQHTPAGHLVKTTLPDGREHHATRDRAGQLIRHANPAGHTTTWTRTVTGEISERQAPLGHKVRFAYDPYGRLQSLTNENGQVYRFAWDPADRLIEQIDLDGSRQRYQYNALDHLITVEHHPGHSDTGPGVPLLTRFERDALGRLQRKTTQDAITEYTWTRNSDLRSLTRTLLTACGTPSPHTLRFDYDALGRLSAEHTEHGPLRSTLSHHYDPLGHLTATTLPDGRTIERAYAPGGHLTRIALDGTPITDYTRDPLHRETARTQGALRTFTRYDQSGRITHLSQQLNHDQGASRPTSALLDKTYTWDHADRIVTRTRQRHGGRPGFGLDGRSPHRHNPLPPPQHHHDRYDPNDHITHRFSPQHPTETFFYDRAANLLDNRIRAYQDTRYDWDGFGRLHTKRSGHHTVQHFHYDAEHRLIRVDTRIAKTHQRTDRADERPRHTRFHWDGLRLLQEEDHFTNTLYLYTDADAYAPLARIDTDLRPLLQAADPPHAGQAAAPDLQAIDLRHLLPEAAPHQAPSPYALPNAPTARGGQGHWGALTKTNRASLPTRLYYFHTDLNGAPEALTDADGEVTWRITCKVWGTPLHEEAHHTLLTPQNLRFQGQYLALQHLPLL